MRTWRPGVSGTIHAKGEGWLLVTEGEPDRLGPRGLRFAFKSAFGSAPPQRDLTREELERLGPQLIALMGEPAEIFCQDGAELVEVCRRYSQVD